MDPVLQRLGDVTIQRLEKPREAKVGPETDCNPLESDGEASNDSSGDEQGIKRALDASPSTSKKFRMAESDNELTEYETESEFESDSEMPPSEGSMKEKKEMDDSFLDKLVEEAFPVQGTGAGSSSGETDDYDYDIKEKLKEMGEISFETVKKGDTKKKPEPVMENEVVVTPAKKSGEEDTSAARQSGGMLRRNIREVMDETKLDESTLAAQRLEAERLKRVTEQHRFLREVQRQIAQERMQNRVLSLLQGNNASKPGTSNTTRIGNTVLVKLPNGQTKPMTKLPKRPFELVKIQKGAMAAPKTSCSVLSIKKPPGANLTPSVSIAPVNKKPSPTLPRPPSDSDSELDDGVPKMEARPKAKTPPVTTIDISSDDDCIVVSETEGDPGSDEPDEDPSNSGMHTNDEFNQPDEQGRVVINIGHPEGEPDIYLAPQIARIIKPHQIGGVRFLFDNLIESVARFENSTGFGCILAHSMGLGKTLQIVCFSDIFLRHTPAKTILCIMPINTLQNWMAEFNMWLPTEEAAPNSPLQAHGEVRPRNFNLHVLNDSHKTLVARARVIREWRDKGGVLLIGYEQYRLLSMRKHPKSRRKNNPDKEVEEHDKNRMLFDEVHEALVKPGPDLVICDEGHRIKNSHASISQALKQMRTKRRVVLTGYPLQNNLMEYWCMVDFVRPNYLGTKTEFCNMFERPIQNGQCIDSTEADIKLMRYRAHVLHSLLVGFVQRRSHTVLQTALPQKEEYVLLVRMTPFQRTLYETFMNEVVRIQSVPNPLKAFAVCCKIWNHPDVLYYFLKKRAGGDAVDIDLEEVASTTGAEIPAKPKRGAPKKSKVKTPGKPAASVIPYSASSDASSQNTATVSSNSNSNSSFTQSNDLTTTSQDTSNSFASDANFSYNQQNYAQGFAQNYPDGQSSFGNYQNQQNYQNQNYSCQQNYWGQNDYYNKSQSGSNWMEVKPVLNNMITTTSPVKSDSSLGESKPKINIISDIKLGKPDMKFNILNDIKLEPKKEEMEDVKIGVKEEVKMEAGLEEEVKLPEGPLGARTLVKDLKEDSGIPYDWAIDLLKDYVPGCIENSAKMEILFCIIKESIALGDRLLVFSQSLITLDLIEQFLQMNVVPGDTEKWSRNTNYYRLDGSTSALEREKLINEFNSNPKIHLFLVSTRAGSLGINLIGANRVVVLDASWNPCHDTQAVCRVYRYGQRKPCFVYRLVVDNCLEKKIYDRQINKQGMSDRVVDECNPDAHLTMKDVSTLCWDDNKEDPPEKDWSCVKDNYIDVVLQKVLENLGPRLNKEPFQHESLLVDRKDKQLSQQEKRLAKKGYEREKQASRQPAYGFAPLPRGHRPVASVRPMQQGAERPSRWIPAEHWQRQGMTAQEMILPLDVVIPTNQADKGNIVLKAGQKVLVLKSPKGVYMQLESGKIVAIKTAIKVRGRAEDNNDPTKMNKPALPPMMKNTMPMPGLPPKRAVKPFNAGMTKLSMRSVRQPVPNLMSRIQSVTKKIQMDKMKPGQIGSQIAKAMSKDQQGMSSTSDEDGDKLMPGEMMEVERRPVQRKGRNAASKRMNASALEQLEQSTSAMINDPSQPFQDTLDNITSAYQEEDATNTSHDQNSDSYSDDVQEIPHDDKNHPYPTPQPIKQDPGAAPPQNDYYNNYYNYNPYPPPPQGYHPPAYPPPPQPSYDMGGYQQPPQYNYGMYPPPPQGYAPPPPPPQPYPPPQGGYDYGHAPQPMYGGYYPPQQYAPPPQGMYPPPNYPPAPDYQYQQQNQQTGGEQYYQGT